MTVSIGLLTPIPRGNAFVADVTRDFGGWRRSIADPGGFKAGTAQHTGSSRDRLDFFFNRLGYDVQEFSAGKLTWQGLVTEMTLTTAYGVWRRSLFSLFNWTKVIYASIGDNVLTNGGGESGVWLGYNAPTTLEQSTAWHTQGTYSIHIVAGAASRGAWIQQGITILALTPYDMRLSVKIISGRWLLSVVRSDNGESLAETELADVGEAVMQCSINDSSEYAGTIHIRIETVDATGEIYADAGVFQRGPIRAESNIIENPVSQSEWGRIEAILLRAAMTVEAANSEALSYNRAHAFPRTELPDSIEVAAREALLDETQQDSTLDITVAGYFATLNFRYCHVTGTADASAHVTSLATPADYVDSGQISLNTLPYQIEDRAPMPVGDELIRIAQAGDVSGNQWSIGVWEGRLLHYRPVPRELNYSMRGGVILNLAGGKVDPWNVKPGWIRLDEAPIRAPFASDDVTDDPRWQYAIEVEYDSGNPERPLRITRAGDAEG